MNSPIVYEPMLSEANGVPIIRNIPIRDKLSRLGQYIQKLKAEYDEADSWLQECVANRTEYTPRYAMLLERTILLRNVIKDLEVLY